MKNYLFPVVMLGLSLASCGEKTDNIISVDYDNVGAEVNPNMYGVFFEEINHAGDGGLYAELIQNRNFEEAVIPTGMVYRNGYAQAPHSPVYSNGRYKDWKIQWNPDSLKMVGWSVSGDATYDVVTDRPLHPNTPNAMKLVMKSPDVTLTNSGYWGIPVNAGERYDLRFYANPVNYTGSIVASIVSADGKPIASETFSLDGDKGWNEYVAVLTPDKTIKDGKFELRFDGPGTVYVDYVSLFPQNTYKGRKNGMRKDVAQKLEQLNPGFIRWPGGCIVEGATLGNRAKWKETIGDPMTRKSEWILWNYHCSWGFGYHEFLQLCEDLGADPMLVANVGLSCEVRNGDFDPNFDPYLQDICDAIEYAQGDVTTPWGAKRAENGHPEPFALKYIELGNEQVGEYYADRYNKMYEILKEKYPDITFISTLGLGPVTQKLERVDMIDPHWYVNPTFFYENDSIFDSVERGKYDIYVGEYAAISAANMDGALSEAAFLTGMERNSDIVKIASYAPLFENNNRRDWPTNLIWINNDTTIGRASYYVQQMFSNNTPTVNLPTTITETKPNVLKGKLGITGRDPQIQYANIRIYNSQGDLVYEASDIADFQPIAAEEGNGRSNVRLLKGLQMEKGTIEMDVKAVKVGVRHWLYPEVVDSVVSYPGIIFGADDSARNYYTLNMGSRGEVSKINILPTLNGESSNHHDPKGAPFEMNADQWYKLTIDLDNGNVVKLMVDDQEVMLQEVRALTKHYAIAGYDEATGETIIKVVNANNEPFTTKIKLNCDKVSKKGIVTTLQAENILDENSFENPQLIYPSVSEYNKFGKEFTYTFPANSFTILRIPTSQK